MEHARSNSIGCRSYLITGESKKSGLSARTATVSGPEADDDDDDSVAKMFFATNLREVCQVSRVLRATTAHARRRNALWLLAQGEE